MKGIFSLLIAVCFVTCSNAKETRYTGSTPADPTVRSFLGISLSDSIDFIRWKLELTDLNYTLSCNYGISKPNTNGFINGGKMISFSGQTSLKNGIYQLKHGKRQLSLVEINVDLLHILDTDQRMLIGNGGWSYTICKVDPELSDQLKIRLIENKLIDSMVFIGRTPCKWIVDRKDCYKLKWKIVLYADTKTNKPTRCVINGTVYEHKNEGGAWAILKGKNGREVYQLQGKDKDIIYLLRLDENILVFTDEYGKLLVGDHDFSYTLNRKQ